MNDDPSSPIPDQTTQQRPGHSQPTAPKKRPAGLWIALILIVLLLLAAGGSAFYYFQLRSTPQKTLQAYCDAIKAPDPQAYYNTLSMKLQAQTSVSELQHNQLLQGGFDDCTVDNNSIQENGATSTGNIKLSMIRRSIIGNIHLVYENGQWKIDSDTFHLCPVGGCPSQ